MIQLRSGFTNTLVFSPRIELPYPTSGINTGQLQLTLKGRTTQQSKTTSASTQSYGDAPRAVKMTLQVVTTGTEDLNAGVIKLVGPDFPAGYYSYILYQANSRSENPVMIDVGVAYLERDTVEAGYVEYNAPTTDVEFETFER